MIEGVGPEVDGGRFPVKRTVGETVTVTGDIHADGQRQPDDVAIHRRQRLLRNRGVPCLDRGLDLRMVSRQQRLANHAFIAALVYFNQEGVRRETRVEFGGP